MLSRHNLDSVDSQVHIGTTPSHVTGPWNPCVTAFFRRKRWQFQCRVVWAAKGAKAAMGQAGQQRSRQKKICNKQLGARWRWVLLPTFDLCSIYGYQSGWTMLMKIFRGVPYGDGSENPMLLVFRGNHYLINPIYPIYGDCLKWGIPSRRHGCFMLFQY